MRCGYYVLFSAIITVALTQRPSYARRPVGYPELETTTTTANPLGNRFGAEVTTQRLPIEALGDLDLVNRISKLPVDKQPFWYLNWKQLEEQRNNAQTYEQRQSAFFSDPSSNVQSLEPNQGQSFQSFQPNGNQNFQFNQNNAGSGVLF